MDFKEATDALFDRVDHTDLAKALGISVASIRQARLSAQARAHRAPPPEWEQAIIQLAKQRVGHYQRLLQRIRERCGSGSDA